MPYRHSVKIFDTIHFFTYDYSVPHLNFCPKEKPHDLSDVNNKNNIPKEQEIRYTSNIKQYKGENVTATVERE